MTVRISIPAFVLSLVMPPLAHAATIEVTSPNGGECIKGGSSSTITWNKSSDVPHIALALKTDGGQPGPWITDSGSYFTHPISGTSVSWSVPNQTTSTAKIWIDAHNGSHASLGMDSSNGNFSIDSSGPATPNLSASSINTTSTKLTWTAATDGGCKGLAGYKIYRNSTLLTQVGSGTLTYTDDSFTAGTSNSYTVEAFDDFTSATSGSVSVSTSGNGSSSASSSVSGNGSASSSASSGTSTSGSTATPTPSTTKTSAAPVSPSATPEATTPVAASVSDPLVKTLTLNGNIVPPYGIAIQTVNSGDIIHMEGTGTADGLVVFNVRESTISRQTQVRGDGTWAFDFEMTDLDSGRYRLTVFAKDAAGNTTTEKDLMPMEVTGVSQTPTATPVTTAKPKSNLGFIFGGIFLLILLIGGGIILFRRMRSNQQQPPADPNSQLPQ